MIKVSRVLRRQRGVAAAAFFAIFVFAMPFPLIIVAAGAFGWFAGLPQSGGHFASGGGRVVDVGA